MTSPPKPYAPHNGLVVYAIVAGLAMVAMGVVRLRLPTRDALHSAQSVRFTYSVMVGLGLLLVVMAVRWRFFP